MTDTPEPFVYRWCAVVSVLNARFYSLVIPKSAFRYLWLQVLPINSFCTERAWAHTLLRTESFAEIVLIGKAAGQSYLAD